MKTLGKQIFCSIRIVLLTMVVCCGVYPVLIYAFAQAIAPDSANGSLVKNEKGEIIGSELIAQKFTRPEYFWPRPSAVDYNATATGGSNLSPTNPALRTRAEESLSKLKNSKNDIIPADLVTTSGSGVDPHISLNAAMVQAERVAEARKLSITLVTDLIAKSAQPINGIFTSEKLVNVLLLNIELDKLKR